MNTIKRFEQKVSKGQKCWNWTGGTSKRYGVFWHQGRMRLAHRVSYELYKGSIPEGYHVCHKCDNGLCVNPDCLFVGTRKDNMQDMLKKGLVRKSRYTESERQDMKDLYSSGYTLRDIAKYYLCSHSYVQKVVA